MKDKIKEIIELNCEEEIDVKYFAKDDSLVYTTMDYSQLLDYITNLQKEKDTSDDYARHLHNENKKLQEENQRLNNQYDLMENSLDEKQEIIDKAIEYIKEDGTTYLNLANQRKWCSEFSAKNILKILGDGE